MFKNIKSIPNVSITAIFFFVFTFQVEAIPQYYCTAANEPYYKALLALIGSIHEYNFKDLREIAVFDLGMNSNQIKKLKEIKKVNVYKIKEDSPNLLKYHTHGNFKGPLGWFTWKPVVIHEALEIFPYVLWLDAGTTVLKPLNDLFETIYENGYFICTIGDFPPHVHTVDWQTTNFVKQYFKLDQPENNWILTKESIMGGIIGGSRRSEANFLIDWYEMTKDIRFFEDDGTTPHGYGTCRHDQTLLSILGYLQNRKIYWQDVAQKQPMQLVLNDKFVPFYITWNKDYVCEQTCIYSSRRDPEYIKRYIPCIKWKKLNSKKITFL